MALVSCLGAAARQGVVGNYERQPASVCLGVHRVQRAGLGQGLWAASMIRVAARPRSAAVVARAVVASDLRENHGAERQAGVLAEHDFGEADEQHPAVEDLGQVEAERRGYRVGRYAPKLGCRRTRNRWRC